MIYAIVMFIAILFNPLMNNLITRKKYCIFIGVLLFLIAALRSFNVGTDTYTYYIHFNEIFSKNFLEIIKENNFEFGWYALAKIVSLFTKNYQILLGVIGVLYSYAVSKFIYKYSKDCMASYLILIPFSFFAFSLSGLRQTLAISIVLLAYDFIVERSFIKYFLCLLLAFVFHNSSLICIFLYFLYNIKLNSKTRIIIVFTSIIVYLLRLPILNFALQYFYTNYEPYLIEQGTLTTLILYLIIWVLVMIFCKNDNVELIFIMGIVLQLFVPLEPNIFRLAMYFQIFTIILVPKILNSKAIDYKYRIVIKIIFIILMYFMYFCFTMNAAGVNPYTFFWEIN